MGSCTRKSYRALNLVDGQAAQVQGFETGQRQSFRMNTKRPYYPFKWQWAEAQAAQVQQQIDDRGAEHIASYERKAIRQKMESLDRLRNERQRFVEMAQRFKQRNV